MPLCTVRESLEFSAELRLPASVDAGQRAAFVDEAMALLELTNLAGRKVRSWATSGGCRGFEPPAPRSRSATRATRTASRRGSASA